jgi:replication factor C subunit 3/5
MLQESVSMPILVPVSSSSNHVELHMRFQSKNARYALMTLANEMSDKCKITEPMVRKSFKGIITLCNSATLFLDMPFHLNH